VKIRIVILTLLVAITAGCKVPGFPLFEDEKNSYSIIISPMNYGSVVSSFVKAQEGTQVTLTIFPNQGYTMTGMDVFPLEKSGKTISISGNGNLRFFNMRSSSVIVSAVFEPVSYKINIKSTANGEITASRETAANGEIVAFSIKADPGYVILNDSLSVIAENSASVAINSSGLCACGVLCMCEECECDRYDCYFFMPSSDVTINAEFIRLYNITMQVKGAEYGEYFINRENAVEGAPVTLTITPNDGYRVKAENFSITGTDNGTEVSSNLTTVKYYIQTRTFSMPSFDIIVNIEFEKIPPGTLSVYFEGFRDEEMDLSQFGNTIKRGSNDIVTVTLGGNFDSYYWYLDDILQSITGNSITIDSGKLYQLGTYTVTAVVIKDGIPYSKIVLFTVVD